MSTKMSAAKHTPAEAARATALAEYERATARAEAVVYAALAEYERATLAKAGVQS